MQAIEINRICKAYEKTKALDNVSLKVNENELFGLIGPDGAGKTTLFRIITTLICADSGAAKVLGLDAVKDYKEIRRRIGYMPGRFSLYQDLTVEENLRFFASIFKTTIDENRYLVEDIYQQIEPFRKRKAGKLSGGMKQKLALSCALIHKPDLLVLDEPTTGVDAVSRKEFWDMLKKLKHQNIPIIVSTPYMDEAMLCERVALIQNGRILDTKAPDEIALSFEKPLYAVKAEKKYPLIKALRSYPYAATVYPFGESVHYTDKRGEADTEEIKIHIRSQGLSDFSIESVKPGIEDAFMALMAKESEAGDE